MTFNQIFDIENLKHNYRFECISICSKTMLVKLKLFQEIFLTGFFRGKNLIKYVGCMLFFNNDSVLSRSNVIFTFLLFSLEAVCHQNNKRYHS